LDLRSLVPLDRAAILESVGKTARLVVVDEHYLSFGLSGEVAATITDHDPRLLRAPVQRVTMPDIPIPAAPDLECARPPRPDRIAAAIRTVLAGPRCSSRRSTTPTPTPRACWPPGTSRTVTASPGGSSSPRSRWPRWMRRSWRPST